MRQGVDYIGVTCVFYCHDGKGKLLLHKRSKKCRDEKEKWDCGGGAMKFGESFESCIKREIKEEYCVKAQKLKLVGINSVIRKNNKEKTHWIAVVYAVLVNPKQVKIGDFEKMDDIGWFFPNKLPKPLHSMFLTHLEFVKKAKIIH